MKVAAFTLVFLPNTGGSGIVALLLANGLAALGCSVSLYTPTDGPAATAGQAFRLHRKPRLRDIARAVRDSDIVHCHGLMIAPLLLGVLFGKPVVVTHHMMKAKGARGVRNALLTRLCLNVAPSRAVRDSYRSRGRWHVIPNPFWQEVFRSAAPSVRGPDVAVVARLVPEKGVDEAIAAFARADLPSASRLRIFGSGPGRQDLEALAASLGLRDRVVFEGERPPREVARALRRAKVQIIPSRWQEPFGLVALEGLASGCRVVSSGTGGLPEALGDFGRCYRSGDLARLSELLEEEYARDDPADARLQAHLARHAPHKVAATYHEVFRSMAR